MRQPITPPAAPQERIDPLPLSAVWYQVVKPKAVLGPQGQPMFSPEPIAIVPTLMQATSVARTVPGARIVICCVVHVNPDVLPPALGQQQ